MPPTPCFGLCPAGAQLGSRHVARPACEPRARPAKRWRTGPRCVGGGAGDGGGGGGGAGGTPFRKRFELGPDDRPESLDGDALPTELTISQQLLMRTYKEQIARMSKKEADELCMEVHRQIIVKDNLLRTMGITAPPLWGLPPDPDDMEDTGEFGEGDPMGRGFGGGGMGDGDDSTPGGGDAGDGESSGGTGLLER